MKNVQTILLAIIAVGVTKLAFVDGSMANESMASYRADERSGQVVMVANQYRSGVSGGVVPLVVKCTNCR